MRGRPASSPRRASQRSSSPSASARSLESSPPSARGLYVIFTAPRAPLPPAFSCDRPGAEPGHFASVLCEIPIRVDGTLAGAEHADEDSQRLGVRHPVAAISDRLASEQRGDRPKGPLRCELTDPAGLVVDGAGIDARRGQELAGRALAALGADPQQVRLEDGRSELLLATLPHGAPRRWDAGAHHYKRTLPLAIGKAANGRD